MKVELFREDRQARRQLEARVVEFQAERERRDAQLNLVKRNRRAVRSMSAAHLTAAEAFFGGDDRRWVSIDERIAEAQARKQRLEASADVAGFQHRRQKRQAGRAEEMRQRDERWRVLHALSRSSAVLGAEISRRREERSGVEDVAARMLAGQGCRYIMRRRLSGLRRAAIVLRRHMRIFINDLRERIRNRAADRLKLYLEARIESAKVTKAIRNLVRQVVMVQRAWRRCGAARRASRPAASSTPRPHPMPSPGGGLSSGSLPLATQPAPVPGGSPPARSRATSPPTSSPDAREPLLPSGTWCAWRPSTAWRSASLIASFAPSSGSRAFSPRTRTRRTFCRYAPRLGAQGSTRLGSTRTSRTMSSHMAARRHRSLPLLPRAGRAMRAAQRLPLCIKHLGVAPVQNAIPARSIALPACCLATLTLRALCLPRCAQVAPKIALVVEPEEGKGKRNPELQAKPKRKNKKRVIAGALFDAHGELIQQLTLDEGRVLAIDIDTRDEVLSDFLRVGRREHQKSVRAWQEARTAALSEFEVQRDIEDARRMATGQTDAGLGSRTSAQQSALRAKLPPYPRRVVIFHPSKLASLITDMVVRIGDKIVAGQPIDGTRSVKRAAARVTA